ncbi:CsbD family protein [Pseudokineococcus basanitobsidens]|uniref:CsbD family protein n=1 Tax=Pseudokineococcus basanitobsidens TaxID=1926649 RepID=A0ABU8RH17_9ACTN
MSATDKIKNAAQGVAGRAKEAVGGAKDDDSMRAEGQKDQASADLKQRGEHVKDAFKG